MPQRNAALIACSPQGAAQARCLQQAPDWHHCPLYLPERYCVADDRAQGYHNLSQLVQQLFSAFDCLVFFCACGIAVRTIAPLLADKYTDPAVVVCDEGGHFAISLLSGHVGGANAFATEIAGLIGAQPVITTATDVQQVFAVDSWAVQQQLILVERERVKDIAARLLQGKAVGFFSSYPWSGELPAGLQTGSAEWGICVGDESMERFRHTLHLWPRNIVLGVGCRKGITAQQLEQAFQEFVQQHRLQAERICLLATIDLKRQEQGLLQWAAQKELPLTFYSAQQLQQAIGDFTASAFVQQTVGVDNVCARSAALASGNGRLLVDKQRLDGITMAAYEREITLQF